MPNRLTPEQREIRKVERREQSKLLMRERYRRLRQDEEAVKSIREYDKNYYYKNRESILNCQKGKSKMKFEFKRLCRIEV
ncbi:MAG: hypothetical protein RL675_1134 [Bacteroidota bacterium]|jgi:hypothetical protein